MTGKDNWILLCGEWNQFVKTSLNVENIVEKNLKNNFKLKSTFTALCRLSLRFINVFQIELGFPFWYKTTRKTNLKRSAIVNIKNIITALNFLFYFCKDNVFLLFKIQKEHKRCPVRIPIPFLISLLLLKPIGNFLKITFSFKLQKNMRICLFLKYYLNIFICPKTLYEII